MAYIVPTEASESIEAQSVVLEQPKTVFWWVLMFTLWFAFKKLRRS